MIVVTAAHNGSGRMRSTSSGTTMVSPGWTSEVPPREPSVAAVGHDTAVGTDDVDGPGVSLLGRATGLVDVVVK